MQPTGRRQRGPAREGELKSVRHAGLVEKHSQAIARRAFVSLLIRKQSHPVHLVRSLGSCFSAARGDSLPSAARQAGQARCLRVAGDQESVTTSVIVWTPAAVT